MSMAIVLWLAGAMAGAPSGSADFTAQAAASCAAPFDSRPAVSGITIEPFPASPGDLPGLRVVDVATGGWMNVYHDAASESVAWARAACLGAQLALLAQDVGDDRTGGRWASVVFTADGGYIPPRDGADIRWIVATTPDLGLDDAAQRKVVAIIPHEQVHAFQRRAGAATPRWFHEGHAEWIGRKVVTAVSPRHAAALAEEGVAALDASATPVALGRWGGISVKREAILRQVSADDRRRMDADPTYEPPGPFAFGPEDMESDESNMAARYQAAWRIFEDLEQAHGFDAVRDWVRDVTKTEGRVSTEAILESAREALGEDLSGRLD